VRIASLVPSATEILFALGLGDRVVAVTHECDHPPEAARLPRLTASVIDEGLAPAEIDAAVRAVTARGEALYTLDEPALAALEPDLIVTQALCAVCAVSYDDVRAVAERLPSTPDVLSLDPETLEEVLGDVARVAERAGAPDLAPPLQSRLGERLEAVRAAVEGAPRPRVLALEWLDPPFVGGHWVPEMIEMAGGADAVGEAGAKSRTAGWEELEAARPDLAVVMPCGLYADDAAAQAAAHHDRLAALGVQRIVAVDAASSFSRPGPRLVDGVELLGHLFNPDRVEAPASLEWRELRPAVI
jgi:iron complex transport system substrate-binding protein